MLSLTKEDIKIWVYISVMILYSVCIYKHYFILT